MSSERQWRASKDGRRTLGQSRVSMKLLVGIPMLVLAIVILGGCGGTPPQKPDLVTPEEIAAEIIPKEGDPTSYGVSLALNNTQRFIDYYNAITLTSEQEGVMRGALQPLKAPCCDDNSMYNC